MTASSPPASPLRIDIGGGLLPAPGHVNVDPVHGATPELRVALPNRLPFADESVHGARASHVLEHIPAGAPRVASMNEIWRVLEPGGTFALTVPLVGYTEANGTSRATNTWHAFADPTHVSHWWFPESLLYFTRKSHFSAHADYGVLHWEHLPPTDWDVNDGWEGEAVLTKPLDAEPVTPRPPARPTAPKLSIVTNDETVPVPDLDSK